MGFRSAPIPAIRMAMIVGASRPRNQQDRGLDYSSSEFHLFGNAERVLDLDPEIADRAFQLRVAE